MLILFLAFGFVFAFFDRQALPFLTPGFLAPVIAGRASDAWGLQTAVFISVGGAVVLLAFGLRETAPRVLRRRAERAATEVGSDTVVAGAVG
ncbi:hypothetical protein [Streptomyces sp. 2A115]|uniref:hypothetical protein n=1 Tax=Streptomyces sp. 2A115 TaxID=3457439 RepID=UPI003FD076CE